MESCSLNSRNYLDEGQRIATGQRGVLGLPVRPEIDHCIALFDEILRLKLENAALKAALHDDESNKREVALLHGKESL